jgi:ubiquinol oxidase
MHLLTFLTLARPGPLMKLTIILAQGIFFNSLFLTYIVSPRTCHRFVAYLEEEAGLTYSLAIQDLETGKLPAWETLAAPDIAVKYWQMPEGERMMRDLLLRVRADEAKHREVNHTLGNLDQKVDCNPFNAAFAKDRTPWPTKGIENTKATGWERKEVI